MQGPIRTVLAALALLGMPAAGGWARIPPATQTEASNGRTVALENGAVLRVRLAANGTTGLAWLVASLPKFLKLQRSVHETPAERPGEPVLAGAGGAQLFEFRAQTRGRGQLRLSYVEPGRGKRCAAERFVLNVMVR